MTSSTNYARAIKFARGGVWYSQDIVPSSSRSLRLNVRMANAETLRTLKRYERVGEVIRKAIPKVNPEFGAYMRYSSILEKRNPHIARAIQQNGEYIRVELQRRLGRVVYRYAVSGMSPADAKKEVANAWEEVLNAKPRWWAINRAQVEFGFHRYTIRGYGNRRTLADIRAQQKMLHAEREVMRRTSRHNGGGQARAAIRSRLRRYANYTGGTHGIGGA